MIVYKITCQIPIWNILKVNKILFWEMSLESRTVEFAFENIYQHHKYDSYTNHKSHV